MTLATSKFTYLIALLAILFTSCSPLIWPTAYQVPSVEKEGDAQLDALTVTTALTLQAAYSPVDHMVLTGAYNNNLISKDKGHEYNNTSLGIGYYTGSTRTAAGVLGQYTFGSSRDNAIRTENGQDVSLFAQATYRKYQIQPYVRFLFREGDSNVYLGFRSSVVQIQSFASTDNTRMNPGNHTTFEPFVGWRFGPPNLKLDLQLGIYAHKKSYTADAKSLSIRDNDGLLNAHIGINYNFNLKGRR